MRQELEKCLYDITPLETKKERIYQIGDLEYLSASELYTGKINECFGNCAPVYGGSGKIVYPIGSSGKISSAGSGKINSVSLKSSGKIILDTVRSMAGCCPSGKVDSPIEATIRRINEKYPNIGTSSYDVNLSSSNGIDKGLKVITPSATAIMNSYRREHNNSSIDYTNIDGSSAGKISNLNNSEIDYFNLIHK